MKIVMTLMVRDEADIIDTLIEFHLASGVDFIVATDHDSADGTSEILERYAGGGVLHRLAVSSPVKRQAEWVTRMARMAATEFDADRVINSDADIWWPWGGSLKEVRADSGAIRGGPHVRPGFLPRPGDESWTERMTVRFMPHAPINSPVSPFRVNVRLLHTAVSDIVVGRGNASLPATFLAPFPGRSPVEVLHFQSAASTSSSSKLLTHYEASGSRLRGEHVRAHAAAQQGRLEDVYDEISITAPAFGGLDDGSLIVDTRIRDAVRALTVDPPSLGFPGRTPADEVGYASTAQCSTPVSSFACSVGGRPPLPRRRPRPSSRKALDASYRPMKLVIRCRPRRGRRGRGPDRVPPERRRRLRACDRPRLEDGTTEILAAYVRDGHCGCFTSRERCGRALADAMARLAATDHGADWVINTDADEFWMPRRGTLKEAFVAVPERLGVVWAMTRHFVPRPDDGGVLRGANDRTSLPDAPLNDPTSPYRPHAKAAHRADPRDRRAVRLPQRRSELACRFAVASRGCPPFPVS